MIYRFKKDNIFFLSACLIIFCVAFKSSEENISNFKADADNANLKLPKGFGASIVANKAGRSRHIVITKSGNFYVKTKNLVDSKGILYYTDDNKDGKYELASSFGNYIGTGITIKNGYLYASSDMEVFRYKLNDKEEVIDTGKAERIIYGLKAGRQHQTKSIVLDDDNNIYVNIGAYSNACQFKDRGLESKGIENCPILDSAGGIWQFKANQLNQTYKDGVRYATGLRNVMGLDWNSTNQTLYVTQHG